MSPPLHVDAERIAEYDIKLMDIDADTLGIPDTEYDARVTMNSSEFARIVRDLSNLGESVRIEISKEGVRFAADGESANGSILLKQTDSARRRYENYNAENDLKDDDDEDGDGKKKKHKVKKEDGAEDEDEEEEKDKKKKKATGDDEPMEEDDEGEFKAKSDDDGEEEQSESEGKKRKKAPSAVRVLSLSMSVINSQLRRTGSRRSAPRRATIVMVRPLALTSRCPRTSRSPSHLSTLSTSRRARRSRTPCSFVSKTMFLFSCVEQYLVALYQSDRVHRCPTYSARGTYGTISHPRSATTSFCTLRVHGLLNLTFPSASFVRYCRCFACI
jgi:hypothetical protein